MGKEVPAVFIEAFANGFGLPEPKREIDEIAEELNKAFIARILNWREWVQKMTG